jgi:curved DNA-binding protein
MEYKEYYKILGIEKDAGKIEIDRTYRKLPRKYHPDINKESDSSSNFREISEVNEVLKNPMMRKIYDTYGID